MKIPSLFKIPNHQRFYIKPRYYDPVKEDVENRERLIIAEIDVEKKMGTYVPGTRVAASFKRNGLKKDNGSILRLFLVIMLFGGTIGYMFYGQTALYVIFSTIGLIFIIKKLKKP